MAVIVSKIRKLDKTRTSILLFCLVGLVWALMELITQVEAVSYSLYEVIWMRYAAHLVFMLVVFAPRLGLRLVATHRLGLQILRGLMMLVMPVSFILAAPYMSTGNILAIFWLAPFIIIGLSVVWLKERVPWYSWVLALAGYTFILVLVHPNRALALPGILLAMAMGLSLSLYIVLTRVLRDEATVTNLFYTAASVLVPMSVRLPSVWRPLTLPAGLGMAAIGLLGFALLWMLDKAAEMENPGLAAPFLFSEMFFIIVIKLLGRIF
jgi:drug/metabolite transporter (DMT)-like permease